MNIGIDASNLRLGGGVTHLVELLRAASPEEHGISKVVVWSGSKMLSQIENRTWLVKAYEPMLDAGLPKRILWQRFYLKKLAYSAGCDLLFVPGGSDVSGFRPVVTMHQNLLPFEWREIVRYSLSLTGIRLTLLRLTQSYNFRKADGVIFLTHYAQDTVLKVTGVLQAMTVIIPHGINLRFFMPPKPQQSIKFFSDEHPCRILYISTIEMYKHQWNVAKAVAKLRSIGLPVTLDLIGPASKQALLILRRTLSVLDPYKRFIRYNGTIDYSKLHEIYTSADISIFASSCETFGQILTESMAAGLPIACSNCSAMPELLGDGGVYFDPKKPDEIADALLLLIKSPKLREQKAQIAFERAQQYSWQRCANDTLDFLTKVFIKFNEKQD